MPVEIFLHGIGTTHADLVNPDLLAFEAGSPNAPHQREGQDKLVITDASSVVTSKTINER